MVIASDGIWEFLQNEMVLQIILPFYYKSDPKTFLIYYLFDNQHDIFELLAENYYHLMNLNLNREE